MKKTQTPYILWLPSWYPNEQEPYNGDFIQRHARAASLHNRITVIFFTQFGEKVKVESKVVEKTEGNLREIIVYVSFKPSGFGVFDRILYNISFYRFSKKILKNYFRQNGLPSLVHVHVPVKSGNLALWMKKKFGIPYIVSEQASTYLKEAPDNFFGRHWLYRSQVKKIFSEAIAVTNVSRAVGKILQRLFTIKRFEVIHNVVDTNLFHWTSLNKEVFTYIHVSSLTEQKNIIGILHAFKRLATIRQDWKLVVVGPFTKELEGLVNEEKLKGLIQFTGEISYAAVADHLQQAHVMVLFSKHENFPCVVVEALCCGVPVVSSDVAGINEAVNASNGILVKSVDEEGFLNALLKIRDTYNLYDVAAIAADAEKQYSYPVIARQFADLYKNVGRD